MRTAAKSELQRAESELEDGAGGALVATLPLDIAVLKAGLLGESEVASHIQE